MLVHSLGHIFLLALLGCLQGAFAGFAFSVPQTSGIPYSSLKDLAQEGHDMGQQLQTVLDWMHGWHA